ncbi:MAG: hypothetical protein LIR50_16735 [Bacillota bacterium]|nr:hypothetical protein [Bacillota bacterium]
MAFIPFFNIRDENQDIIEHDSYDVYVNDDFIGRKVLYSESEDISNISDYLSSNGYGDFTYTEDGNKFIIEDYDEEEADRMKNQLETYLNIR